MHNALAGFNLGFMAISQGDGPIFLPVPPRRLGKRRPLYHRKLSMIPPSILQSSRGLYPECQLPVSSCTQEPDNTEPPPMGLSVEKSTRPGTPGTEAAEEIPVTVNQQLVLARSVKNMTLNKMMRLAR